MSEGGKQLEAAIAALEAQRALLGDAVVDTALAPMRRELAAARAAESTTHQELKQVSVLFVDVVESTAMGQRLDPEEIHAVMDGALERFTLIVQTHHGRVLKYTGDGMLAVFGSQVASEDDVESAIRAGLGIIEEALLQASHVRQKYDLPKFEVRAGVHTGMALLGGGVDTESSIRGDTVNVAARMEQSAPPGRLRITHDSYSHVRGLFDVVEQAPISVKGVAQPLRTYLVERATPEALRATTRGIEGMQARMVGRESELKVLQAAFGATIAERRGRAVTVVGEAGLGKSRLLAEFRQSLDLRSCWLLAGRAHPRSALHSYGLLRDIVTRHLRIGEWDAAALAERKLVAGLGPLFVEEGEAPIHILGQLIGLNFATSPHVEELLRNERQFKAVAFDAGALYLRRLTNSRPVVMMLDDLHWADDGSLEFVRFALRRNSDVPLLSVMLTRPSLFEQNADWIERGSLHTRLDLMPLDKVCSRELADTLLQRVAEVPAALRALITDGAEGNPFYMEELVKMLIDDGVIVAEADGWRVMPDKLLVARVPPTLTGVLQARLDALGSRERNALRQAAVVGHIFWDQALAAIDPSAVDALPALLRKQFVVRHDSATFDDTHEYAFQHHLLHQIIYDTMLKEARRHGHEKVGAFWSARAEVASPQEVNAVACRALAEAHAHRRLADPAAFASWFDAQFSNYYNAYAIQTLRPLVQSTVEMCERHLGPNHVETARALTNLARAAVQRGETETAEPALQRALAIQEQVLGAHHPDTARTLAVLGGCFQGRGDDAAAEPCFRRALEVRERVLGPEHPLTLGMLVHLAHVVSELGRMDEAEVLSRRALCVRERTLGPEAPETAIALTTLGEVLAKKGEPAAAEPLLRRALAVQQKHLTADNPDIGFTLWHLAEALRNLARLGEAEPLARRALEIWERHFRPDHEWIAFALISVSKIRLARGDAAEAAVLAERAAQVLTLVFGPEHAEVGSTLKLKASALQTLQNRAAAESHEGINLAPD